MRVWCSLVLCLCFSAVSASEVLGFLPDIGLPRSVAEQLGDSLSGVGVSDVTLVSKYRILDRAIEERRPQLVLTRRPLVNSGDYTLVAESDSETAARYYLVSLDPTVTVADLGEQSVAYVIESPRNHAAQSFHQLFPDIPTPGRFRGIGQSEDLRDAIGLEVASCAVVHGDLLLQLKDLYGDSLKVLAYSDTLSRVYCYKLHGDSRPMTDVERKAWSRKQVLELFGIAGWNRG